MLGTGNALVTEVYNTCFVIENENQYLLVDGGGGSEILKRLKDAKISIADIHHIFVTHKHIDHILGIVWMTRIICQNMQKGAYEGDAYIYGHEEVISLIQELSEKLTNQWLTKYKDIMKVCNYTVGQADSDNTWASMQDNGSHIISFNISLVDPGDRDISLETVCDGETFGPLTEESQRYFFCATKQYTQLEG